MEQGFPEWTELGQDSGLDPLGMQRPIEVIYQSLIPGISTITLRFRYYSFFPLILKHYEEHIRDPDPMRFRLFHRKCEALYALVCTYGEPELGITGSDWAHKILNEVGKNGAVDFTVAADPNAAESQRYLRNERGAFGGIYATQMSDMGLIHFPTRGQPNPNPVCSGTALALAEAFSRELGGAADQFFRVVQTGTIRVSSLESLEAMKPSKLKPGSNEHTLLTNILFGHMEARSERDLMRRSTLKMLLAMADASGSIPRAEQVKWHWFENAPVLHESNADQVPKLWFLFQACDLTRLAYEAILSAALTLLKAAPRRRMSLDDLTDELAGNIEITEGETWKDFSQRVAGGATVSAAQKYTLAMMNALDEGETAEQVRNAVSLIAILSGKALESPNLIEEALSGADYFQSLRTEAQFLDRACSSPADRVITDLIRERIIKRHLWVASRKFRKQSAYTFHMEPEEGVLRYRSHFGVSPSSPRIVQALRFLQDVSLINKQGTTPMGRAAMAAA